MRIGDLDEALRMIENSKADNPFINGKNAPIWKMAHDSAISCVTACSVIDAVPVIHAKWEKIGIDYKHEASLYECSACGKIVRKYWEDERFECCPYCFARMDGE